MVNYRYSLKMSYMKVFAELVSRHLTVCIEMYSEQDWKQQTLMDRHSEGAKIGSESKNSRFDSLNAEIERNLIVKKFKTSSSIQ